jgi:hypothetical protein
MAVIERGLFFETAVGRVDTVVSEITIAHTEEGHVIQESDLGSRVIQDAISTASRVAWMMTYIHPAQFASTHSMIGVSAHLRVLVLFTFMPWG